MFHLSSEYRLTLPDGSVLVFGEPNNPNDPDYVGFLAAPGITTNVTVAEDIRSKGQQDGAVQGSNWFGARTLAASITLLETDPVAQAMILRKIFKVNKARRANAVLDWVGMDGIARQIPGLRINAYPGLSHNGPVKTVLLSMTAANPFIFGELRTVTKTPSSFTLQLDSDEPSFPKFWAYGPFDWFQIRNSTTGEKLRVNKPVADGHYIYVDTETRRVLLDGVTNVYPKLDFSTSSADFFSIGPDSTQIEFSVGGTTGANTKLRTDFRDHWS